MYMLPKLYGWRLLAATNHVRSHFVTATLSSRGQIIIPRQIRDRLRLRKGDQFIVEDDPSNKIVTLRKASPPSNWFEVYMQCPASFEVPPRRRQMYRDAH